MIGEHPANLKILIILIQTITFLLSCWQNSGTSALVCVCVPTEEQSTCIKSIPEEVLYEVRHLQLHRRPSPPLWMGASTLPGARRVGRMADGFVAGPSTDLANIIELVEATGRQRNGTPGSQWCA